MTSTALRTHATKTKDGAVPIIPDRDPRDVGPKSAAKQFTVTLPQWMYERVEAIAKSKGYTRNEFVREACRQLVDEMDGVRAEKKAAK
jgi:hypothetical protein